MDEVAVGVAEYLHFDMPRAAHQLLQIDLVLAESGLGLALGREDGVEQLVLQLDRPHAAPAAAPGGLEHQGIADADGRALDRLGVVGQRLARGHHGHADRTGEVAGRHLVAEDAHGLRPWTDEDDAGRVAGLRELRIFGEEAVAGVDGVDLRLLGDTDDFVDREIGFERPAALAYLIGFVCLESVQGKLVFLGIDRDRLDTQLGRRPEHADRDLRAIGDQQASEAVGHTDVQEVGVAQLFFYSSKPRRSMKSDGHR